MPDEYEKRERAAAILHRVRATWTETLLDSIEASLPQRAQKEFAENQKVRTTRLSASSQFQALSPAALSALRETARALQAVLGASCDGSCREPDCPHCLDAGQQCSWCSGEDQRILQETDNNDCQDCQEDALRCFFCTTDGGSG